MVELIGDAGNVGDWAWIRLGVSRGTIVSAAGEGPGVEELAAAVTGLTLLGAAAVPGERLATDALAAAVGPVVRAAQDPQRVAVAMSGGVDSAVALLKARARGDRPVGVTLRLWLDPDGPDADRACCSPESVVSARKLCHRLGVPHVTLDQRAAFRHAVVSPFVASYGRGETPNPCIHCNGSFRFASLLAFARRIGARQLVTGHYARLAHQGGRLLLARAADTAKDQSYMLALLDPAVLDRLWFPLGDQSKQETRAEARAAGLEAAGRSESQEACFLAGGDYRAFLGRNGLPDRPGKVVDLEGQVVGEHAGHWRVTTGQRRGIGISSTDGPLYAIRTDPSRNVVVVGPRSALGRSRVSVRSGRLHVPVDRAEAKLRYRSPGVTARVSAQASGFRLDLDEPFFGVAPGQAAVLYKDGVVVGAGLISGSDEGR